MFVFVSKETQDLDRQSLGHARHKYNLAHCKRYLIATSWLARKNYSTLLPTFSELKPRFSKRLLEAYVVLGSLNRQKPTYSGPSTKISYPLDMELSKDLAAILVYHDAIFLWAA